MEEKDNKSENNPDDEELDEDDLMMEQAFQNQEHHSCSHWKPKAFEKKD